MKNQEITVSLRCHETRLLCLHEKYAQSIPVLCCKDLSFWSKAQTMCKMSKNMEYSNQKTWSTSWQNLSGFAQSDLLRTTNPSENEPTPSSHCPRFEPSVPESSSKIRSKKIYSKISSRSAYSFARWNMVFLQESTLDSSYGCSQIDQRSSCYLFGSFAFQRDRKPERMDAIHRNHSSKGQKTHLRRRMRQFSRCQETRLPKSLDTSAVSLSFNPSIPIEKRALEASNWSPEDSGINLSTGSSSAGTARWSPASSRIESLEYSSTPGTNNSAPHVSSRILTKRQSLSKLSNSSIIESAKHDQHHRINEPINPRSDASMWQSTHSRIAPTLDNSFYTYAT